MTANSHNDEVGLHDEWAASESVDEIDVLSSMEGVNAVENSYLISRAVSHFGSLEGLKILDVGSGLGESSVYFAKKGAIVTATDLSPGMVDFCRRLAEKHNVGENMIFRVMSAEDAVSGEALYDVVYCANLLHHLDDPGGFVKNAAGCLKEKGMFLSFDPIESNPAIKIYRSLASNVRSADERPLKPRFAKDITDSFSSLDHHEYWLFAQLLFVKYFLINRLNPGESRYWKLIYRSSSGAGKVIMRVLHKCDRFWLSLPLIRNWAWNMAIVGVK